MNFEEFNIDELPDGHPLKAIVLAAREASSKMEEEIDNIRDARNNLVFGLNNELRDKTHDEIEWMRALETIVTGTDRVMGRVSKNPRYIQADILRAISEALVGKAVEIDHLTLKHSEISKEMNDKIREGDKQ